jgi:hypothetical protein
MWLIEQVDLARLARIDAKGGYVYRIVLLTSAIKY